MFQVATRDNVGNFRQALFSLQGPGNIKVSEAMYTYVCLSCYDIYC